MTDLDNLLALAAAAKRVDNLIGDYWPSEKQFSAVLGNGLPELLALLTPDVVQSLVARVQAAEAAVPEDPWQWGGDGYRVWCYSCEAVGIVKDLPATGAYPHDADCAWVAARAALAGGRP